MLKEATLALDNWTLAVELYSNCPGQYEYGAVELTMQRLFTEVPAVCLWAVLPR